MEELAQVCRVCLQSGIASWNLFHKRNMLENNKSSGVALDRLLEKFRYVTLLKINEQESLPRVICDLCIVQLNVSYNFKRQAVEADSKFRQYIIEKGICLTTSNYNMISSQPTQHVRHPSTTSSTVQSRDSPQAFTEFATTVATQNRLTTHKVTQKQPTAHIFRPMPIQIKVEPLESATEECELISNMTISPIHSDQTSDVVTVNGMGGMTNISIDTMPPVLELEEPLINTSTHFNSDTSSSDISMVRVNNSANEGGSNGFKSAPNVVDLSSLNKKKDMEFINNYVSTNAVLKINGSVHKDQPMGGIIVAGKKCDKDKQQQAITMEDSKKADQTALKIKEEKDIDTSSKRYSARRSIEQSTASKKTNGDSATKPSKKTFHEMEIEIFTNRLRRLDREKKSDDGIKATLRTNQLKSRLNQLKELNRKQTDKNVKSLQGLKAFKKKKEALVAVKKSISESSSTRKYKNPFSKTEAPPKSNVKKKTKALKVTTQQKSKVSTQKLSAIITNGRRSNLKQKEKNSTAKAEK